MGKNFLTSPEEDFSQWFLDLIFHAQLAEYSPTKGCIIIRPNAYVIWERIQEIINKKFKAIGIRNMYFPCLIPEHLIEKEKTHVEGFAPELATVTQVGKEKLEEAFVLRPTSETMVWESLRDWMHSYRDLPIKINQWANVFRWEKKTKPFLRTNEFLWQEGHSAHSNAQEANDMIHSTVNIYQDLIEKYLAIPAYIGKKTDKEKFSGAKETFSLEILLKDKKILQAATSHNLGDNFSRAFNVQFQNQEGGMEFPYTCSWGISTRMIGALIMAHGDERGLILPPLMAETELIILPILSAQTKPYYASYLDKIHNILNNMPKIQYTDMHNNILDEKSLSFHVDLDQSKSFGYRCHHWELMGIPLRIEFGLKEIEAQTVTLVRRDLFLKETIPLDQLDQKIPTYLQDIQNQLYQNAQELRKQYTFFPQTYSDLLEILKKEIGFFKVQLCNEIECEDTIKKNTPLKVCCLPLQFENEQKTNCLICQKKAERIALLGQSY